VLYVVKLRQEHRLSEQEIAARTDRTVASVVTKLSKLGRWRLGGERRPFLPSMEDEVALAKASLAYEISCAIKERGMSPPFKPSSWV